MRWGERASERARRGEEAFNQVFLGEGGKGERVTCASPHHTTCSSQSLCLSVQSRGHICHLLLKKNEMSLFPIFPRGPFIPIFAPSFRNSFRRKEEGKGSKKEGRGRRRGIGRRRSGSWSDIAWKSSFFWSTKEGLCRGGEIWLEFQFSTAFFPSRLRHRHCRRQCPTKSAIANMTQKVGTTVGAV